MNEFVELMFGEELVCKLCNQINQRFSLCQLQAELMEKVESKPEKPMSCNRTCALKATTRRCSSCMTLIGTFVHLAIHLWCGLLSQHAIPGWSAFPWDGKTCIAHSLLRVPHRLSGLQLCSSIPLPPLQPHPPPASQVLTIKWS